MTAIRTRWAALGAALAVTFGGGGLAMVDATSPTDAVAFVPIEPCRIVDTRSDPSANVGERSAPLEAGDTHTVIARGDTGECISLPETATAVSLNVTAVNATQPTFLTVWANTGASRPDASSLNPAPGQPPTPNAVTTELSDAGEFNVFNFAGSVDVIIDVNGYYTDHAHDDRYLTEAEVDALIAAAEVGGPAGPQGAPGQDGVDGSALFDRTIVVNGGASSAENGEALLAAIDQVAANQPTVNDPWTVWLEPGRFEIERNVDVPDHVTIVGSGMEATTIEKTNPEFAAMPMLGFGVGALRNLEILGSDQSDLVQSEDSLRVESVRFIADDSTGLDLDNGPHVVVGSEFQVLSPFQARGIQSSGDVTVMTSTFVALAGTSVELIGMDGGEMIIESSSFSGDAVGIYSCCFSNSGELTLRHSTIDVSREAIQAELSPMAVEIEGSTLTGVGVFVVELDNGGTVVMTSSTLRGGGIGGSVAPATLCRGTSTIGGFLTTTCP